MKVARKNRKAVKLYTTGGWPSIAQGVEQYGLSGTRMKLFRNTAAACSGVGGYQACQVTTIGVGMGQQHNPTFHGRCIFSWWLGVWDENREMHQLVGKAWKRALSALRIARCRWRLVYGTMSSVIATLVDLGWIPHEPHKWKSLAAEWWEYTGGTFTNILDEIHQCTENTEWTEAGTHLDGTVLEHGVDLFGFHRQHAWLVRKDLHGKAGLLKAAAAGGLWPTARLRAADERYDGFCPKMPH